MRRRSSSAWVIILSCLVVYLVLAIGFRSFVQPVASSQAAAKVGPPVELPVVPASSLAARPSPDPVKQVRVDAAQAAPTPEAPPAATPRKTPRKQFVRNPRDQYGRDFRGPFDYASRGSNNRPWF